MIKQYIIYFYALVLLIFTGVVFFQNQANTYDKENLSNLFNQTNNIFMMEPPKANYYYNDHLIYIDAKYDIETVENSIILTTDDSVMTIFLGLSGSVNQKFFDSLNPTLTLSYDYVEKVNNEYHYFLIWEYPDNPDKIQVMMGIDDQYIAGVFPTDKAELYITDMAYTFNSIRKEEMK